MTVTIDDIQRLVVEQLGSKRIWPEAHFIEDLGAESADIINIIVDVEETFEISIDDSEIPDILRVDDLLKLVKERVA